MRKPSLTNAQILNMNLGFFGTQFGWGLQMANMSAIYEYLGASPDQIPMLWLAAPLTGLIVQPIIGHLSDHTWGRLGRRRPYFLTGAILSSIVLIAMPNSRTLWMAAGLLWILDASINISMEPFREFVADVLPDSQRTKGFAVQSLLIGLGAVIASALPWLLVHYAGLGSAAVKMSFYIGSAVFLGSVVWTVAMSREYPPEDMAALRGGGMREIVASIAAMPVTMRRLGWVQICTWLGLFCMWLYFPVAVAHHVFGADDPRSPLYTEGVAWGGMCFAMYSAVCFAFSFLLEPISRRLGRPQTHGLCLLAGALGLLSVALIHDRYLLLLS
jgi:maltose/moltooligosaccharide transporter